MEIATYELVPQNLPKEIRVVNVSYNEIVDFAKFLEDFFGYGKVTFKKVGETKGKYGIFESAGSKTYDFYFRNLITDKKPTKFANWTFSDYGEKFIINDIDKTIKKAMFSGIDLNNYAKIEK